MAHELTAGEIASIKEEIHRRESVVTPQCIAEVQRTRAFGDLSENDEYRTAKRELNRNYSRIRYLKNLLENGVMVEYTSEGDEIGLFDKVTLWDEDYEEERVITLVTHLRADVLNDRISLLEGNIAEQQAALDALRQTIDSVKAEEKAGKARTGVDCTGISGSARYLYDLIAGVSPSAARDIGGARQLAAQLGQMESRGYNLRRVKQRGTWIYEIPSDFDDVLGSQGIADATDTEGVIR